MIRVLQEIVVRVDGRPVTVRDGTMVAAAVEIASPGRGAHVSPTGARRLPLCGMGVCGECRVTVDGRAHRLGCQVACAVGMEIRTDD
jgi:predicted molibdopterin-dependent oxidoreductase YjgC